MQLNDQRLSLLLPVTNRTNAEAFEQVLTSISKGKSDVEVLIIKLNSSADAIWNKLAQTISGKELIQKDKLKATNSITESLQQATGSFCVYIEQAEIKAVPSIIAVAQQKRKKVDSTTFYTGTFWHKESNNKSGFFGKLGQRIYNSFYRFSTTSNVGDNQSGVWMADTKFAAESFTQSLHQAKTYPVITTHLGAAGILTEDVALNADKFISRGRLFQILFLPFISYLMAFSYYVIGAFYEIKNKSKAHYSSGNGPLFRLLFFVTASLLVVAYPMMSQDFGMTWDEKQHDEYSKVAYNWVTSMGEDTAALAESTGSHDYVRQIFRHYGEHMNLIAALVYNTFDTDPYDTRHFIISLYGLIGLLGVGLTLRALTSWRGGLIAMLFIAFNPSWMGFSMNNPTDIPFAAGFALSAYFMVRVLKRMPNPRKRDITWLGIGIGIGIGSRVGALLIIAYMGLFMGFQWLYICIREKRGIFSKGVAVYFRTFLSIALLGYIFGILLWPYALSNPLKNVIVSFKKSSENAFYANNTELFEGKRIYMLTEAPGYYVVKFLSMGNPLYLLVGVALTILLTFWIRRYINIGYILMFVFMMVFPVAWAEYTDLNYYNGWRHYLFVLPSIVVLSAMSYEYLFFVLPNKVLQYCLLGLLTVGFGKPLLWMVKNYPNLYVYFNETVGGINGAYGVYETDYYSNSCREAAEWLAKELGPNSTAKIAINNEPLTASYYGHRINPKLDFFWVREYEEFKPRWDYMILTTRTYGYNELRNGFPHKGTIYKVMADDIPLCIVIKRENNFMPDGYEALARRSYDTAATMFQQAIAYDPMNEESHRMLATTYLQMKRFNEAKAAALKAVEIFPENYSAYSVLGQIYFNEQRPDSAVHYFDIALHHKRNITEAYYYAGNAMMQMNKYSEAADYFEKGIGHNGQIPEMYYSLGVAYLNLNSLELAEQSLSYALGLNQNYAPAYYSLAQLYQRKNDSARAQEAMRRYQALAQGMPIN